MERGRSPMATDEASLARWLPALRLHLKGDKRRLLAQHHRALHEVEAIPKREAPSPGLRPPSPRRGEGKKRGAFFSGVPSLHKLDERIKNAL